MARFRYAVERIFGHYVLLSTFAALQENINAKSVQQLPTLLRARFITCVILQRAIVSGHFVFAVVVKL